MSDSEKLLPCPFCGSAASLDVRLIERPNWWSGCVLCDGIADHGCSAQIIVDGDTEQEAKANAIAAWNRRADAAAATLGHYNAVRYVGLRRGECWERTENSDYYCGGCGWKVTDHDSYCPECGGALHEYALGAGTCHDVWDVELTGRLRFQCSECGGVSLEITPRFCPCCGRKVVTNG